MSARRAAVLRFTIECLERHADAARAAGNDRQAERYMRRASRLWARVKGETR